eukprot:CAMPEP_0201531484 /NCGR_PEP_ID=MMETSP0161_2-20130828/47752_1 /ASSEMBLY_ACC=CAM_ASM_000251 /TAXON_ID=180227 /ORGANISM="Neoparamoeba aestuarina, Strain SoJaBio B1-5/56/2" /LENGTH=311 /DNA_ID=CAMNT_0047934419 /DNA_START=222 /DNA_END=1154 /DNA_ORIENTATION=+
MSKKSSFSQALIVRTFEELRIGAYPMFAGLANLNLDRYVVSFLPNIAVAVFVLGCSLGGGLDSYNFTLDSEMFWKVAFVLTERIADNTYANTEEGRRREEEARSRREGRREQTKTPDGFLLVLIPILHLVAKRVFQRLSLSPVCVSAIAEIGRCPYVVPKFGVKYKLGESTLFIVRAMVSHILDMMSQCPIYKIGKNNKKGVIRNGKGRGGREKETEEEEQEREEERRLMPKWAVSMSLDNRWKMLLDPNLTEKERNGDEKEKIREIKEEGKKEKKEEKIVAEKEEEKQDEGKKNMDVDSESGSSSSSSSS